MFTLKRKQWGMAAGLALLWSTGGHAANIFWLSPLGQQAAAGDVVSVDINPADNISFDLYMSFDDPTLGGGLDVTFDNAVVASPSFTFDSAFAAQTDLPLRTGTVLPGELNNISFGNFFDGIGGTNRVGTLSFDAAGFGSSAINLADNDFPSGPFYSATTFSQQQVAYYGSVVNVVPELPVAWMMAVGLGIMLARRAKT